MLLLCSSLVLCRCALGFQVIKTWKTIGIVVAAQMTFLRALYAVVVVGNILKSSCSFSVFYQIGIFHVASCSNRSFIVRLSSFLNIRHRKSKFVSAGKYQNSMYFKKCFKDTGNFSFRVSSKLCNQNVHVSLIF